METYARAEIMGNFRTERYAALNKCRWDHFLTMGIPIKGKTIFEPGAGIGDQTEWLLEQGANHIFVNEGRPGNVAVIRERFGDDKRVSIIHGDIETCLAFDDYAFFVDLIFCYGVYYHLREDKEFTILRQLSLLGEMVAFDYLAGSDNEVSYGYDNPSTSISQYAFRPRPESMEAGLKDCFAWVYRPQVPLDWQDPVAAEDRRVLVGSHFVLDNPNVIQI